MMRVTVRPGHRQKVDQHWSMTNSVTRSGKPEPNKGNYIFSILNSLCITLISSHFIHSAFSLTTLFSETPFWVQYFVGDTEGVTINL